MPDPTPHSSPQAAVRIQSRFRGFVVRKAYNVYKVGWLVLTG
jgi:hypothetical protein